MHCLLKPGREELEKKIAFGKVVSQTGDARKKEVRCAVGLEFGILVRKGLLE